MNERDTHSRIPDPDVALEGGVDATAGGLRIAGW